LLRYFINHSTKKKVDDIKDDLEEKKTKRLQKKQTDDLISVSELPEAEKR